MAECDFQLSDEVVQFQQYAREKAQEWGADAQRIETPLRIVTTVLRHYGPTGQVVVHAHAHDRPARGRRCEDSC